jgi:hypothetical protein
LALFGRRLTERVVGSPLPAAEDLHTSRHSSLDRLIVAPNYIVPRASQKLAEYICTVGSEVCALLGSKGTDLRRRFGIDAQELELG